MSIPVDVCFAFSSFFFLLLTSSFRCPYRKLLAACAIIAQYVGPTLIVVCGVDVR